MKLQFKSVKAITGTILYKQNYASGSWVMVEKKE